VAGSGHPLADAGAIPLGALRDLPLVCLPRGTGVRAALDAACAEAGFARGSCSRPAPCPWWSSWRPGAWDSP